MALLTLDRAWKGYPDRPLLQGVSLSIDEQTRVGVVGPNGSGKSTLLRVLAGEETLDEGRRQVQEGLRIGVLGQAVPRHSGRVRDAVRSGLVGRDAVLRRLAEVHDELGRRHDEPGRTERLLDEAGRLETRLERLGGHEVEHRVEALIEHVGLSDPDAPADRLSGGEQRRVALARVLLSAPDLLLLDEPTNHLDAFVVDWLEDELLRLRVPLVMVTHDRYFLDRVVDQVIEVDRGSLHVHEGGYAGFLRGQADRQATEARQEVARQSLLRRETDWMRRGPPARSTKAKARIERYHRLLDDAPAATDGELAFRIPSGPRLGTRVVRLRGVTVRVGERELVRDLDLDLGNRARLGIVGPNGAGKTTLLRVLTGAREPDLGTVEHGETVRMAAIDQLRTDLDPDRTVVQEVAADLDHVRVGGRSVHVEGFLDQFLFPGPRKQARIERLSGGERNRVLLAKLLLARGNLLVLDEPTNDLDLPTLRALEEALVAFDGAVVVVSHDRWFLDRVATEILHLDGRGGFRRWGEHVSSLLERLTDEQAEAEAERRAHERRAATTSSHTESSRRAGRRRLSNWETEELDALPAALESAEERVEELTARLADPALYVGPVEDRERVQSELDEAAAEVERLYARWEELDSRA